MKLSSADETLWRELGKTAAETGFTMICGAEHAYLMALHHGACGVIGEGCNLYPEILCAVKYYHLAGAAQEAERAQLEVNRLLKLKGGFPAAILGKALALRRGCQLTVAQRTAAELDRSGYAGRRDEARARIPTDQFMVRYDREIERACAPYADIAAAAV
jgi:dihydrodipicolinate synthase/N-acetylneuraminate lyase